MSSAASSGPYGVIDAIAVPGALSAHSRASRSASRASRSASRVSTAPSSTDWHEVIDAVPVHSRTPSEATTRLDPVFPSRQSSVSAPPTRPVSVSTTRSGPTRPHSRDPSLIPDSSIDRPEERPTELPPQGGPSSGPMRRQQYKDARGRFAREPQRATWNPDDAPGDTQPASSTEPPRGRPKAKAKAEPKARAARRARSKGGAPYSRRGAKAKSQTKGKTKGEIVRHCEGPIDPIHPRGQSPATCETNALKDSRA